MDRFLFLEGSLFAEILLPWTHPLSRPIHLTQDSKRRLIGGDPDGSHYLQTLCVCLASAHAPQTPCTIAIRQIEAAAVARHEYEGITRPSGGRSTRRRRRDLGSLDVHVLDEAIGRLALRCVGENRRDIPGGTFRRPRGHGDEAIRSSPVAKIRCTKLLHRPLRLVHAINRSRRDPGSRDVANGEPPQAGPPSHLTPPPRRPRFATFDITHHHHPDHPANNRGTIPGAIRSRRG